MVNINYIEICNKTKVGEGFIWFTGDFKNIHYLIIDIAGERFIITGKYKVLNLY